MFQSHNGAIAAWRVCVAWLNSGKFQSHNGAIAAGCVVGDFGRRSSFNPTMVRLLLGLANLQQAQFVVSIPQWCDCCRTLSEKEGSAMKSFNPTMVRLLHFTATAATDLIVLFQSHNGAIAAGLHAGQGMAQKAVSIPQWCDCCKLNLSIDEQITHVSIPQWCDCCNL